LAPSGDDYEGTMAEPIGSKVAQKPGLGVAEPYSLRDGGGQSLQRAACRSAKRSLLTAGQARHRTAAGQLPPIKFGAAASGQLAGREGDGTPLQEEDPGIKSELYQTRTKIRRILSLYLHIFLAVPRTFGHSHGYLQ